MKTSNKVSVGDFEKVYKRTENTVAAQWEGIDVEITKTLSLDSMMEFVHNVTESCFTEDGDYLPEVRDFLVWRNVLERYANFRLPENLAKSYDFIYGTDAVEFVLDHVNCKQFNEMMHAVEEKIQFRLDTMADSVRAKLNEFVDGLNALQEQTKDLFGSLSEEDMQKLAAAVADGGVDEEKLVAAYISQQKAAEEPEDTTEG